MNARTAIAEQPPTAPGNNLPDWRMGLTPKEALFVEHYVAMRNATQAYSHAYDTNGKYDTRAKGGREVLNRAHVQEAVRRRMATAEFASTASVSWLLQRCVAIATADPRELIGLKVGACRYCWGQDHLYHWREREYLEALDDAERLSRQDPRVDVKFPDPGGGLDYNHTREPHPGCPQCQGEGLERFVPRDTDQLSDQAVLLYGGVKVKKDGYEIIIADQQKAADMAGRIMGAFTEKVRLSGTIASLHAVGDLRSMDPADAAKAYRDFIAGNLAA